MASCLLVLVLSTVFSATSVSSSPTQLSYGDHCASIVPESRPTRPEFTTSRFTGFKVGYFTGGTAILGQNSSPYSSQSSKSLSFRTRSLPSFPSYKGSGQNLLGSFAWWGWVLPTPMESLNSAHDSNYFEPISILIFPEMNYKYTLASSGAGCPGGADVPETASLSTNSMNSICSMLSMERFGLEYAHDCNPSQNCSPFGGGIGYLPQFISFTGFQCSDDEEKLQVMVKFRNSSYDYYRAYNPSTTLIGEGSWDVNKNQLCLVACRILNEGDSLVDARIGDCSIKLSLRFPSILSIRNRNTVVGQIWNDKTVNDPGFFSKIMFQSIRNRMTGIPGSKYEYTEIERARKLCLKKKPAEKKGVAYPNGYSSDMQLDMSVRNSTHLVGWAYSELITLGDKFYDRYAQSIVSIEESSVAVATSSASTLENSLETNASDSRPMNVSYRISLTLEPGVKFGDMIISPSNFSGIYTPVEISAEGIYDAKTGFLCMVGCRKLSSPVKTSSNDSMDCEILVNLQFPQLNSKNRGYIKGSMESTREKSDPLYFEHLDLSANSFFGARQSIWRMDFEIIMVLISHTLSCVFVGLQLFYVKKHSEVLPSISLVMLVVLTLGYMIPLVLNFEALFLGSHDQRNALLESGGWIKANEQMKEGHQKGSWAAEKKVLYLALPSYVAGCLIALFFTGERMNMVLQFNPIPFQIPATFPLGDLRSYAGLVLDGFLFPQILLNMFTSSTVKALSIHFIWNHFVRLLPHTYDLYRAHNNAISFNGSYIYANPGADFYSTAWDVIILVGSAVFCYHFLQQRFGGRCILPKRFRELEAYEKIPVNHLFTELKSPTVISALPLSQNCPQPYRSFITLPFSRIPNGYCIGGDRIINQDPYHYSANFSKRWTIIQFPGHPSKLLGWFCELGLEGFWSNSSGKLCMVGSGSAYSSEERWKTEYYRPFNPSTTLVGEARWDDKRNRLCVVACRILNTTDSLANARVGIVQSEQENHAKKDACWKQGTAYPEANSFDMQFDMSVKSSTEIIAWVESHSRRIGPENISYKMSFKLKPGPESDGIINPFSSSSSGCRKLRSEIQILTNDSMDCEILVSSSSLH
ncbi:hypothetical protein CK203_031377 [Vitis vinifera]|uniref:RING-type E3 ubiquitin transferase n=1 Tax=Vitis vinifera TaxID=29760 RepID=A0A438I8V0_VITVI|nr:hypothetical protein CK203_031377 [Vitis vinifera]